MVLTQSPEGVKVKLTMIAVFYDKHCHPAGVPNIKTLYPEAYASGYPLAARWAAKTGQFEL